MKDLITIREPFQTDFTVYHSIDAAWSMQNFHFHDVYEIYYSLSKDVKYFVEDKVYPVEKGDVFIFNDMDLHKTVVPPDISYERYVLVFSPAFIKSLSTPVTDLLQCFHSRRENFSHRIHLSAKQSTALLSLLQKAKLYCSKPVYGTDIYKKIILAEILLYINTLYQTPHALPTIKNEGEYSRIKPVIAYIDQHLDGDLSLDHLSAVFYMNKYHMGSVFRKATGFTLHDYIITRRIQKARELLRDQLPVSKVGEMVGYNNPSHFTRTFKNLVGASPKKYAQR